MGALLANWKTTLAGLAAVVAAFASDAVCDWIGITDPSSREAVRLKIVAVIGGIGLMFARDSNVTSEQSGAK